LLYTNLRYIFVYSLTPFPMPHQGEILQEAIKNSGISITRIVEELGITRPTIYRKFKDDTVDAGFVKRIGEIIGHDFANDFTLAQQTALPFVSSPPKISVTHSVTQRVTPSQPLDLDYAQQLLVLQTKYIALLEAYNELLLKVYGPK
jgi:plasmid maintenance system antidote protein VapI